jgi:hypothetical protein
MSDTISPPSEYLDLLLTLNDGPNGHEGVMTIGTHALTVARWQRIGPGQVRAVVALRGRDPWLEEWAARLASKVAG